VNYRPQANIIVRPEVRIDWSPAADYDESYFGVDAIVTF
jgi:outer membrane scaffolding protein for murein synthesis (MipA/OmpV family)